jgi:D-alanyl-D-alanine carboxypeptidase/D-alanyl-D-alanine-endopeptidase (penicillin-binding protein 4)
VILRARIPAPATRAGVLLAAALLAPACASRAPAPLSTPPVVDARDGRVRVLQRDLADLLDVPALRHGSASVVVRSADRGDVLFRYRDGALVMPASTLKLVTLAAAADRLGWDHTFTTTVRATGPIAGGVLEGDLVVEGTGDPSIGGPEEPASALMDRWAEVLWTTGVRHVDGAILGEDTAFDGPGLGEGWAWDDMAWGYSAPVGALQANADSAEVRVTPAPREGEPAIVTIAPGESGLQVESAVRTGPEDAAASLALERDPGSTVVRVTGLVPAGAAPIVRTAAVRRPTDYFLALFESALARRGILARSRARAISAPPGDRAPAAGRVLLVHRSPPLRDLAATLMKASQNQYAETLLRALARSHAREQREGHAADTPACHRDAATVQCGRDVVGRVLTGWGLEPETIVMADGSGLSRYNLVTAGSLAEVLFRMSRDPRHREPWLAALAVAGVDGTLERRFQGTTAQGRVRAKTGSLSTVRALAGYVPSAGGEQLLFVIVLNHVTAPTQALNGIVDGIVLRLAAFRR